MNNRRLPLIILGVVAFIVLLTISSSLWFTIEATDRAIMFYPFGKGLDKTNVIGPGTHMKAPWNDVYIYKVNEMSSDENMDVLDKNGLSIHVDITVRFFPVFPADRKPSLEAAADAHDLRTVGRSDGHLLGLVLPVTQRHEGSLHGTPTPRPSINSSGVRTGGRASFPPCPQGEAPGAARGSASRVASASERSAKPTRRRSALEMERRHRKLRGTHTPQHPGIAHPISPPPAPPGRLYPL